MYRKYIYNRILEDAKRKSQEAEKINKSNKSNKSKPKPPPDYSYKPK